MSTRGRVAWMRHSRLALVALVLTATLVVQAGAAVPWSSGVTSGLTDAFGRWRGSPVTIRTVYFGKNTWNHIRFSAGTDPGPLINAIGFPMLPETARGQLERCAAGGFDPQMRAIVDRMRSGGWEGSIVRLGWEMNRVFFNTFPWHATGNGSSYVGCFRRWVGMLNPPGRKRYDIAFNPGNSGGWPHPIDWLYPGDRYVDLIGANYFDRCAPIRSEAYFQERMNARDQWGNPAGPGTWLAYARSRGKPWILPEWGIGGSKVLCPQPGEDNPFFIRRIHAFLLENARFLAYESLFNSFDHPSGTHRIFPTDANPKAAAEYQRLW